MQPHLEVRRWMEQAALLVMPSVEIASGDSEGLGMVMCEAQALGLPGIGFRGTGVEEALAYGDSGLLVPPRDQAALAEAIVQVLTDDALRESLAIAGRQHAKRCFDLHRQTGLLEQKYREVLSAQ
jgi:colanic acid/amylovoran biosynthesis glycosyltransferase